MSIKKRRDENGELETVLEGSIDEVTQPGAVDALVEEAGEFTSALPHFQEFPPDPNPPEPLPNPPVKSPKYFTGDDLAYFLVWGMVQSNEDALTALRDSEAHIVRPFAPESLINVTWYMDAREIRISVLRRLGGEPGLSTEPNILNTRTIRPDQGVIRDLGLPNLVMMAQNDAGKTMVQTFKQLKDFSIQGESQSNVFAQALECVQFTASEVLFWEEFALVEDEETSEEPLEESVESENKEIAGQVEGEVEAM